MYDGLRRAGRGGRRRCWHDRRTTFVVVTHARGRAAPRGRVLHRGAAARASFHLGALVLNKVLPDVPARRRRHGGGRRACATTPTDAGRRRWPRCVDADADARSRRVLREVGESFLNFQVVAKREAEQRAELAARARGRGHRARTSTTDIYDLGRPAAARRAALALSALGARADRPVLATPWPPSPSSLGSTPRPRPRRDVVAPPAPASASWGLLADLCFADLLLFVPDRRTAGWLVVGQVRPATGQTLYPPDWVGTSADEAERPLLTPRSTTGEIVEGEITVEGLRRRRPGMLCIPVRRQGRVIAVLTRESAPAVGRQPGELERTYRRSSTASPR